MDVHDVVPFVEDEAADRAVHPVHTAERLEVRGLNRNEIHARLFEGLHRAVLPCLALRRPRDPLDNRNLAPASSPADDILVVSYLPVFVGSILLGSNDDSNRRQIGRASCRERV